MKPRLLILGPQIGRNTGRVTTQGERLADLLARDGYPVDQASSQHNRYLRALHICFVALTRCRFARIVILQIYSGPSFLVEDIASFLVRLCSRRIIMHCHGGNMPEFQARFPNWTARVLARADMIITPSRYLERSLCHAGVPCAIIPNTIELTSYPYRHRARLRPKLLWMRAFHPQVYNPAMAIRVFARVKRQIPEATLVMAGQYDPAQRDVERLAHELGVANSIRFAGFLDMRKKKIEAEDADIFINTNRIDNTPVGIVEAFAFGLPVVATEVGGIADLIVDGETGLLVPMDADNAMAEAIVRLLRDPELAGRLSSNGRKYAETCGWDAVKPHWEQILAEVSEPLQKKGNNVRYLCNPL
jgi:glycosyltransferase involved in cell wall biosynthesis